MGSKGSTRVEGVDPFEVGRADAQFNRIDQFTPLSSLQFFGPNRNQAVQTLNPAAQFAQNQDLMADMMVNTLGIGRAADIKGGSLPSLTSGVNPTAQQDFFGLPQQLTSGFDPAVNPVPIPDFVGDFQSSIPAPQGSVPTTPPQKGGPIAGTQPPSPAPGAPTPDAGLGGFIPGAPDPRVIVPSGQDPFNNASGGFGGIPGGTSSPVLPPVGAGPAPSQSQIGSVTPPAKGGGGGGPTQQTFAPPAATQSASDGIFGGSIGNLFNQGFGLDQEGINRGRTEQALFDRSASLMDPQFDRAEERLIQDLANRGIPRDSEAGRRELTDFRNQKSEAFTRLSQDAIAGGGQEVTRQQQALGQLFGMGQNLAQQDIFTQLQNANIQQANRATQFNELAALLGLNQVAQPGLQNFFTPGQADVTGGFALNQQANMANAQNSANMKGGLLDAGVGLATAGIAPGGILR